MNKCGNTENNKRNYLQNHSEINSQCDLDQSKNTGAFIIIVTAVYLFKVNSIYIRF